MAVIVGTSDPDFIVGTAFSDTITGLEGDDLLNGEGGDDTFLIAGSDFGRDEFVGGSGTDLIRLSGNVAVSSFLMTSANVFGIEALHFDAYYISGTAGNDNFDLSGLAALIDTRFIGLQEGNDVFIGHAGPDQVDGGLGEDTLTTGAGDDWMFGNLGDDLMNAGDGDDVFLVYGNYDQIGNDIYNGGMGNDVIRLHDNVYSSRFLMGTHNVVDTERLDFITYSLSGTTGADLFDLNGLAIIDN